MLTVEILFPCSLLKKTRFRLRRIYTFFRQVRELLSIFGKILPSSLRGANSPLYFPYLPQSALRAAGLVLNHLLIEVCATSYAGWAFWFECEGGITLPVGLLGFVAE